MLNTVRVPDKFAPLFELAQSYVTRYFADQRSAPERGTLEVSGQRYMLVRAASMSVEFHDMVPSYYREDQEAAAVAHALLFDVAHAMGLADSKAFAERMNVTDPIARLSAGPVHFAHAGWAFVDISPESNPSPDEHYYLLYDHPYSFESDSWLNVQKATEHPVCVMNTGYSSGWCDDDAGVRSVAQRALTSAGYHVVTATNGTEGISLLERGKGEIRLALVDVTMPEMSGFDLVRELRERGLTIPVVLSSGYELDAARAKEAGSSGVLAKPYDVAELLRAVERVLGEPK